MRDTNKHLVASFKIVYGCLIKSALYFIFLVHFNPHKVINLIPQVIVLHRMLVFYQTYMGYYEIIYFQKFRFRIPCINYM